MSKEVINYNIISLLLSDCKYSKDYKVLNLYGDIIFLEKDNKVIFPFNFNILNSILSNGGNEKLSKYVESKFKETINLPY